MYSCVSLVGCHLWGRTESDTTEATQQQQQSALEQLNPYNIQCGIFVEVRHAQITNTEEQGSPNTEKIGFYL